MRLDDDKKKIPQGDYCNEVFGVSDPDLIRIRTAMRTAEVDFMSLAPAEARILQFLIQSLKLKRILELGTLYGYTALVMAQAVGDDGSVITLDKDPRANAIAAQHFSQAEAGKRITALCGEASVLLSTVAAHAPFDMIFIDANKPAYVEYLNWAEGHLRPGGLIVGDNTFLQGAVWGNPDAGDWGKKAAPVMREFNARLADPSRYNSMIIPTGEGLTVAQRR